MKKIFVLFLVLVSSICVNSQNNIGWVETSTLVTDFYENGILYEVTSKSDSLTVKVACQSPKSAKGDIVIPEYVEYYTRKYKVTSINNQAFFRCNEIYSITIPNTVSSIGEDAFSKCKDLSEINVAKDNEFYSSAEGVLYNKKQTELIRVPEARIGNFIIPNTVTSIAIFALRECVNLASVSISDGVGSIGKYAFYGCSGLRNIEMPNSVTHIEDYTFAECINLNSIKLSDSTISIASKAFYNCMSILSINLPSTISNINKNAFKNCKKLNTITVDKGNLHYSSYDGALYNKNKTNLLLVPEGKQFCVDIANSVIRIESRAFSDCSRIELIDIPNSVQEIGEYVFDGCARITAIAIPGSVISIGEYAFRRCNNLKTIDISKSVKSIGAFAFFDCENLMFIEVADDNMSYSSLEGVLYNKNKTELIQAPVNKEGNFKIPNTVTIIKQYAFSHCKKISSIDFSNSIISIGEHAFESCFGLTSVILLDSLKSIGEWAFYNCKNLQTIDLPKTITNIGNSAFHSCSNLTAFICNAEIPPKIGTSVFRDVSENLMIALPNNSVALYKSTKIWKDILNRTF